MKKLTFLIAINCFVFAAALAQVPRPQDVVGFTPGDDRKLASWAKIVEYFQKLDAASDRVVFEEIGKTTMGAPFVYATISSPENLKDLDRYRSINAELADPRRFQNRRAAPEATAKRLIRDGKTIVLITCGVHSTEVGSTLSSMLIAHRLASTSDPDTLKILKNTIILLVPSLNPDGVDIVKNWYDKTLGTKFEGTEPPELYHKYVGHDNNRDWYAFTQVETQLTVDKIHNVWHPQIVHDIHQQGQLGSRLFLPPYMQPVEPNVPKQIVEGYTELGNAMAADLRSKGFQGITTNSTYDAWTPARAYSHYHGGVRILSETASARLATPITVKWEDIRGGEGYDARKESANFGPVWRGGDWGLRDITNYMTTAAFSLLDHAADDREKWLSRFYQIGKEAVRPRKDGELRYLIANDSENLNGSEIRRMLHTGGVAFQQTGKFTFENKQFANGTIVIPLDQPYGSFAKTLLENQVYPDLKDASGIPQPPYDVTAHTLPLLLNSSFTPVYQPLKFPRMVPYMYGPSSASTPEKSSKLRLFLYRSYVPSMDEGWTRWVFENYKWMNPASRGYSIVENAQVKNVDARQPTTIVFPDQSPGQILNGYSTNAMPIEYTGGIGIDGVANLRKFVRDGGTLVFLNRSSQFAIEQFNLPVKDVTRGLPRKDFYIPGSILRTELDITHPIAKGMPRESIAWFENSPAFGFSSELDFGSELTPQTELEFSPARPDGIRKIGVIARYPTEPRQILLSGWALGAEKIAGKAALVEFTIGNGKIVLFGFRPQYRGQSLATFPLLFNAISQ